MRGRYPWFPNTETIMTQGAPLSICHSWINYVPAEPEDSLVAKWLLKIKLKAQHNYLFCSAYTAKKAILSVNLIMLPWLPKADNRRNSKSQVVNDTYAEHKQYEGSSGTDNMDLRHVLRRDGNNLRLSTQGSISSRYVSISWRDLEAILLPLALLVC